MKLKTKLNVLIVTVLMALTLSLLVVGLVTINDIFAEMNNRLLQVDHPLEDISQKRTQYLSRVVVCSVALLGLSVIVSTLFVRRCAGRIQRTLDCVHAVERGDLGRRLDSVESDDEIGDLQRSLNSMISKIEKRATEQQRDQEALLASEAKYRSIFENAIEGIYQSHPDGHFLSVNPAMARILGYDSPQDVLEAYTDIRTQLYVEPEDRDKLQSSFNTQGRAERFETQMYHRGGKAIWVSITASAVRGDRGTPLYYEGIIEDITERKRAEREIRRLNEELEQRVIERTAELESANRELQDFAYAVSHDLKAPLRAINQLAGWINADYGEVLGSDGTTHLVLLMGRVRRMHRLIEGILQYSRIGRVREKKKEVDLDFLAREVIDLVSPPQCIDITIESRLPVILGEQTRLAQLFQNLLDNAIKYMDKPNGKVIIDCLEQDAQWMFRVSDNGPGIEEKYYEKIFQIFQTLAPRDETESTGIGLALVKRIVETTGGSIWVESEFGKGATFWFTIPKRGEKK